MPTPYSPPAAVDDDAAAHKHLAEANAVDISAGPDGGLTLRWAQAPSQQARAISADDAAHLDQLVEAVTAAESKRPRQGGAIAAAHAALGRALFELLDGPERALTRRLQACAERDQPPALTIRLRAEASVAQATESSTAPIDASASLAAHPAAGWRWALLADSRGPLAARQPGLSLAVQLGDRALAAPGRFALGGVRILFMAFSPEDTQPVLDYEREEEHVLTGVSSFVRDGRAQLRVVEHGSLDELRRCLLGRTYDIVHLSGHGVMTPDGPRLLMEDEFGARQSVSPDELLHALRRAGRMPELVMISSCHSAGSRDGAASLAAQLVAGGVPTAIGWAQPVRDDLATQAAADIYQRLCTGATPAEAVAFARCELFAADLSLPRPEQRSHTWATLSMVTRSGAGLRLDPARAPLSAEPVDVDETYAYLDEGHMRVLKTGFIGRRRPLQRLIRILLRGEDAHASTGDGHGDSAPRCAGAVILGMKGVGKSSLAGRAIQRLSQEIEDPSQLGLVVLHGALDNADVYQRFLDQAERWEDDKAERILSDAGRPLPRRLKRLLQHWRRRWLVIVLDDFERNLDTRPQGDALLAPAAAALLETLVPACRTSRAKLVITTTASFAVSEADRSALAVIRLGPFDPASVKKLYLRGQQDGQGEVAPGAPQAGPMGSLAYFDAGTWEQLCERLGRNPRVLDWARALIAGKSHREVEALAAEAGRALAWERGEVPSEQEQQQLVVVFLSHMAYQQAIERVSPDARTFIKRARVYDAAVPARAFTALCEDLDLDLDQHLPGLQNLGLLEAGTIGPVRESEPAYRVSPLVEAEFDVAEPARWHAAAAAFWAAEFDRSGRHEYAERAWTHACAGHSQDIAERMGHRIRMRLLYAGLYRDNLARGQQHLEAFPHSVSGNAWAAEAMRLFGDPRGGWAHYARAESLAAEQKLGGEALGTLLHQGGMLSQALGDLGGARKRLERSLAIHTNLYSTDEHPHISASLHALAGVLYAQGDPEGARERLERSLAIQNNLYGTDERPSVAALLHALAGVLYAQGDLEGAREHLERSLAIKNNLYGTDEHPDVSASLHELARVLHAQGDLEGARERLERSLAIDINLYGTDKHPDVSASLHELAGVLVAQGDLAGARERLERALDIDTDLYGTDEHPHIATSLHTLSSVLYAQGNLEDTRVRLEHSLAIHTNVYGTDEHPEVATSLDGLAALHVAEGDHAGAVSLYRRVLQIRDTCYKTRDHYKSAVTEANLADCLMQMGETEEATALVRHAAQVFSDQVPNHPMLAQIKEHFGPLLEQAENGPAEESS